jgi:hypothetical protein
VEETHAESRQMGWEQPELVGMSAINSEGGIALRINHVAKE